MSEKDPMEIAWKILFLATLALTLYTLARSL